MKTYHLCIVALSCVALAAGSVIKRTDVRSYQQIFFFCLNFQNFHETFLSIRNNETIHHHHHQLHFVPLHVYGPTFTTIHISPTAIVTTIAFMVSSLTLPVSKERYSITSLCNVCQPLRLDAFSKALLTLMHHKFNQ